MLKLLKSEFHNFGIFKGTHVIDYSDKDIIGIVAEYEGAMNRSNRGGKSLTMETISYNLVARSRAKKEVELIHNGEDHMYVTNTYLDEEDGRQYVIKRGRDIKGNGVLELDWITKSGEAQQAINDLFGVNKEDFPLTNYFEQSDIHGFMNKTPAQMAEHIMNWVANDHWTEKEALAKKDRDVVKGKLKNNETIKSTLELSLENPSDLEVQQRVIEKEMAVIDENIKKVNTNIQTLDKKILILKNKKDNHDKEIKRIRGELSVLKGQLTKAESNENATKLLEKQLKEEQAKVIKTKSTEDLYKDKSDVVAKRDPLYERWTALTDNIGVGGLCPVLGESCDRIKFDQKQLDDMKASIDGYGEELKSINGMIKLATEQEKTAKKIGELQASLKSRKEVEGGLDPKTVKDKIAELELKIAESEKEEDTTELDELNERLTTNKTSLTAQQTKLKEKSSDLGKIKARLESSEKSLVEIGLVADKIEKYRAELETLNYICLMFGKNGIPSLEIENAFGEVEDNINFVLESLKCGLNVMFSPEKELDKWETACSCGFVYPKGYRKNECEECELPRMKQRKEEISFKILENGSEANFSMDSGGGKTIVSYAVRIALTMLKRQQNKCRLNMLFLDEVDSALDPFLAGQIISSITQLLTKKLGYSQVLVVSHKEEIKSAFPHILKVTRHKTGNSSLEFI